MLADSEEVLFFTSALFFTFVRNDKINDYINENIKK